MRIRIAVIGCGAVFEAFYLDALRKLQNQRQIEVTMLVDNQSTNLDKAKSWFPRARIEADVSAVTIAVADRALVLTPPASHCAIMLALADNGLHVYCEKPLTVSVEEARRIATTFAERKLLCKVGYVRRLFPNLQVFRDVYRQLAHGAELSISDGEVFRWPIKGSSIFSPETAGGGVVWDKLSHNLDMVQWIAGLRGVDRVHSRCRPGRVPADILVEGQTESGRFRVAVSWTEGLGNLIRARSSDALIESKNGLSADVYNAPVLQPSAEVSGAATYAAAVESALGEFLALTSYESDSRLASAIDSVALTAALADIDAAARQIKS